jgi:hypothetical protein
MPSADVPLLNRERADAFLRSYLGARPHGAWRKEVVAAAAKEGLSPRMIARIAVELGIVSRNSGRGGAIWSLPPEES